MNNYHIINILVILQEFLNIRVDNRGYFINTIENVFTENRYFSSIVHVIAIRQS